MSRYTLPPDDPAFVGIEDFDLANLVRGDLDCAHRVRREIMRRQFEAVLNGDRFAAKLHQDGLDYLDVVEGNAIKRHFMPTGSDLERRFMDALGGWPA